MKNATATNQGTRRLMGSPLVGATPLLTGIAPLTSVTYVGNSFIGPV